MKLKKYVKQLRFIKYSLAVILFSLLYWFFNIYDHKFSNIILTGIVFTCNTNRRLCC